MKKFSRTMSSRLVSTTLLAVIIGALCFSVGEGLRLTPFPVSAQELDAGEAVSSTFAEISLSHYGPLDVPARAQKRNKRYAVDFTAPGSPMNRDAVTVSFVLSEDEAPDVASVVFIARPSGRAPPFAS
jgi:hypothetical protein